MIISLHTVRSWFVGHLLLKLKDCTQGVARLLSCYVIRLLLQHQLTKAGVGEQVKDVDEEEAGHDQDGPVEQGAEDVHRQEAVGPVEPRRLHHLAHQVAVIKKPLDRLKKADVSHVDSCYNSAGFSNTGVICAGLKLTGVGHM